MSWEQLLSIGKLNKAEVENLRAQGPIACPNDGTPLQPTPDGAGRFCVADGYTYPRDGWGSLPEPRI